MGDSMTHCRSFARGVTGGLFLSHALHAVNWLFGAHPSASTARHWGAVAQAIFGIGLLIWMTRGVPDFQKDVGSADHPDAAPTLNAALADGARREVP